MTNPSATVSSGLSIRCSPCTSPSPPPNPLTDKESLQRQMDSTDRQTDRLLYDLYRLTEDEIKIVEEATQG